MLNSVMLFIFSDADKKYLLLVNLVQKLKINCISWNLVPSLIGYAEFYDNAHFFSFGPKIPIFRQKWSKNQNCLFKMKLDT